MKAIAYLRYGGPEVMELIEIAAPRPVTNEVLIRVAAVGLNPVDVAQRQGTMRPLYRYHFPKIAGNELSGVIVESGPGATRFSAGERVITRVDKHLLVSCAGSSL
ncbi:MAG TPA: alcohol dehydrogenase catalytic domain-containing protein [Microbacteriaceae bacterium]